MIKPELTKEEEIANTINDFQLALIESLKVERKITEVQREKTKCRYNLQQARQRLNDIELSIYS